MLSKDEILYWSKKYDLEEDLYNQGEEIELGNNQMGIKVEKIFKYNKLEFVFPKMLGEWILSESF